MQKSKVSGLLPAAVGMVKVSSMSEAVEKLAYLAAMLIGVGFLYLIFQLLGPMGITILVGAMGVLLVLKLGFLWFLK